MRALLTYIRGELRRRRLQAIVVLLIVGLASGVGTVATLLFTQASAPYMTAFQEYQGAHLAVFYNGSKVTNQQLLATTRLPEVTTSGGPWQYSLLPLAYGTQKTTVQVIARPDPGGPVDQLRLTAGRWVTAPGEIVLTHSYAEEIGAGVGNQVELLGNSGPAAFGVVGEVADIDEASAADFSPQFAWIEPGQLQTLLGAADQPGEMVVYRFQHAATAAQVQERGQEIAALLPPGAETGSLSYLTIESVFNLDSTLTLTFLLAFAVFALGAAALIVANVVSGAVLSSQRDIGVVKALGFTPGQVVAAFVGQMLVAAVIGCLLGVPLGAAASHPLVGASADALGLPAPSGVDPLALLLVTAGSLLVVAAAAAVPALRAGLLPPVEAISETAASRAARPSWIGSVARWLRVPRPIALGAGDAFARPVRGLLTTIAVMIGVTTLVFAFGLNATFQQITSIRAFGTIADVTVSRYGSYPDARLMQTLEAEPDTRQIIALDYTHLSIPGLSDPVTTLALRGDSAALGYPMVAGRWFAGPGEVVGGTAFVSSAHLKVGDTFTGELAGHPIRLRLVGVYFTLDDFGEEAQVDWSSYQEADPSAQPSLYLVDIRPGASVAVYASRVEASAPEYLSAAAGTAGVAAATINILNAVLIALVAILVAIAVAGVFNTLLLHIRERIRDTATLKALGMTPGQVISMVVASACVLGLLGAILGVPAGIWLHQWLLTVMGSALGSDRGLPSRFTAGVYRPLLLPLLALAGIFVAVLGAALPAWMAARAPAATVLHAE
ncbi:MAG: ABC transporter permease [Ktedonobacterales bacterium]